MNTIYTYNSFLLKKLKRYTKGSSICVAKKNCRKHKNEKKCKKASRFSERLLENLTIIVLYPPFPPTSPFPNFCHTFPKRRGKKFLVSDVVRWGKTVGDREKELSFIVVAIFSIFLKRNFELRLLWKIFVVVKIVTILWTRL